MKGPVKNLNLGRTRELLRLACADRDRARKAARERKASLRSLMEVLPAITFIHQDGKFRRLSRPSEPLLGYAREELFQMNFWDVILPEFREMIRDRGSRRQRGEAIPARSEIQILTKSGEKRWLDCTAVRVEYRGQPAVLGAAFDITERKLTEETLSESEGRFRALFESAPFSIALHDANGGILNTNRAYQEMLGYSADELRQLGAERITHPDDVVEGQRLYGELRDGRLDSYRREKRYLRKDGRLIWAQSVASAVRDASGRLRFILSTVEDTTKLTTAQRRQRALSDLGHRLSAASTQKEAARVIAATAGDLLGWDACYLHVYSRDQKEILPVLTMDTLDGNRIEIQSSTFTLEPSPMMRRIAEDGPQLILREGPVSVSGEPHLEPFGDKGRRSASLMFVPIHSDARILGVLSIQSYASRAYSKDDLDTLQAFADHCGGALKRIEAAETLRRSEASQVALLNALPDWILRVRRDGTILDCKVREGDDASLVLPDSIGRNLKEVCPARLADPALECVDWALRSGGVETFAFQHSVQNRLSDYEARIVGSGQDEAFIIVRDFSEQARLEQEVLTISGHEQQRIGKDLHDGLGQSLTGMGFLARALEEKLASEFPAESAEASQIGQIAAQALAETRRLVQGLYPLELERKGLFPALLELAFNAERMFKVSCTAQQDSSFRFQSKAAEEHVYRLVQEAVSNAIKHGRSTRVAIEFNSANDGLILQIRDNGVGIPQADTSDRGMGVRIMRYRARKLGAELETRQNPDGGTIVTCIIPLSVLVPHATDTHEAP